MWGCVIGAYPKKGVKLEGPNVSEEWTLGWGKLS